MAPRYLEGQNRGSESPSLIMLSGSSLRGLLGVGHWGPGHWEGGAACGMDPEFSSGTEKLLCVLLG